MHQQRCVKLYYILCRVGAFVRANTWDMFFKGGMN